MENVHWGLILFNLKKVENFAICENMDEPGRDYAKWNKPNTEGQYHMMPFIWWV